MSIDLNELERLEKAATKDWVKITSRDVYSAIASSTSTVAMDFENDSEADLTCAMRNALPALIECARACEFYADDRVIAYIRKCGSTERLIEDGGQRAREAFAKLGGDK